MTEDEQRRARAEARRTGAVLRMAPLAEADVDAAPVHGAEAVSLVHRLTLLSRRLAGRTLPTCTRAEIPVRFVPRSS